MATSAFTLRARLRARLPLVPTKNYRRTLVPLLSMGIDVGPGWLGQPGTGVDRSVLAFGTQLRLELVVAGRITPYASVGYGLSRLDLRTLHRLEFGVGVMVRLGGTTVLGPKPGRSRLDRAIETFRRLDDDDEGED